MKIEIDSKVDSLVNVIHILAAVYCVDIQWKIVSSDSKIELTDKSDCDSSTSDAGKTPITLICHPASDSFAEPDDFKLDDETSAVVFGNKTAQQIVPPPPVAHVLRGHSPEHSALPPDANGNKPVVPPPQFPGLTPLPPQPPVIVTVLPPPPPQEPAQVSTGANEGLNDELDSDGKPWDATIHSESRAKNVDGTWRKRRITKNVEVKQSIPGLEAITPNSVPAPPSTARKIVTTMVRINGAQNVIKAPEGATDAELSAITGQPTVREGGIPDALAAAQNTAYANAVAATSNPVPAAPIQPQVTGYQPTAVVGATIPPPPSGGSSVMPPPPPAAPAAPAVIKTAPQGSPVGTFKELMERITQYFSTQQITSQDLAVICATYGIPSIQHSFAKPELVPQIGAALDAFVASRVEAA